MKRATLALAALVLLGGVGQAKAGFIITFSQDGANVDANGTGSFNLTALTYEGTTGEPGAFERGAGGVVLLGPATGFSFDEFGFISGPSSFGTGPAQFATSGSGPPVGVAYVVGDVVVPQGYVSGTPLTSSATWDNTTISGLGLTPGTYTYTWGSGATADSLEVVIPSASAVPEPAALTLLCTASTTALGYFGWRRRRTATA